MTYVDLCGWSQVDGHLCAHVWRIRQFIRLLGAAVVPVDAAGVTVQVNPHHLSGRLQRGRVPG